MSASWTAEPQASVQLPNATDTPMSDAVGMVVTEMPTAIIVLDRASVSEMTPTTPARAATREENELGASIRLETGDPERVGRGRGREPSPTDNK